MAKRLRPRIARPDVVLCSPARRAQDTARVIVRALHYRRKDIVLCAQLYRHRAVEQLEVIRATGARCKRLMLFGHNPQLSTLAHQLGAPTTKLSTCAVLRLVFDIDSWSRIGRAALIRFALDRPARSRTKRR